MNTQNLSRPPGRPPKYGVPLHRVPLKLTAAQADQARVIGNGNLSYGIRRAIAVTWRLINSPQGG